MQFDAFITINWKTLPMLAHGRSTGFILEGFPNNSEELEYMIQQQLFPDLVVVMEVDVSDVQMRLLPLYLSKWQVQHEQRVKQRSILQEQHKKNRVRQ